MALVTSFLLPPSLPLSPPPHPAFVRKWVNRLVVISTDHEDSHIVHLLFLFMTTLHALQQSHSRWVLPGLIHHSHLPVKEGVGWREGRATRGLIHRRSASNVMRFGDETFPKENYIFIGKKTYYEPCL